MPTLRLPLLCAGARSTLALLVVSWCLALNACTSEPPSGGQVDDASGIADADQGDGATPGPADPDARDLDGGAPDGTVDVRDDVPPRVDVRPDDDAGDTSPGRDGGDGGASDDDARDDIADGLGDDVADDAPRDEDGDDIGEGADTGEDSGLDAGTDGSEDALDDVGGDTEDAGGDTDGDADDTGTSDAATGDTGTGDTGTGDTGTVDTGAGDPECLADLHCGGDDPCLVPRCVDGICVDEPVPDGGACDDLDECTNDDACVAGICQGAAVPGCAPTSCEGDDDCVFLSSGCLAGVCVEGFCETDVNVGAFCDATGPCIRGGACARTPEGPVCRGVLDLECEEALCETNADCDDGNPCTRSTCNRTTGVCSPPTFTFVSNCSDDPCVEMSVCVGAQCGILSAVTCDGPCVEPVCNDDATCTPLPEGSVCDDGDPATEGTICVGGDCRAIAPGELCNPGTIPLFACTVNLRGADGVCREEAREAGATCGFSTSPCTRRACDGAGGCVDVPVDDGRSCTTPCGAGTCVAGTCEAGVGACGFLDNACGEGLCTEGGCIFVSDDLACDASGSNCDPVLQRCNDGTCGNGICAGSPGCGADCNLARCQVGCDARECSNSVRNYPFRGTWRSAESTAYGFPMNAAHQTETITRQLEDGVRMLHLNVDYCSPGATSGPLCICPGDNRCSVGASTPLLARLQEIRAWMVGDPNQVIILIFDEANVAPTDLRAVVAQAGLTDLLFAERVPTNHRFDERLVDLIRHNRRLLIFGTGFLPSEFLFVTDSRRRTPADPAPGSAGYADWYPGFSRPFAPEFERVPEEEECEVQGQAPGNPPFYIVRHVLPQSADGPPTSFEAAGCFNRRLVWHLGACAGRYPQLGMARHSLMQFYNASAYSLLPSAAAVNSSGNLGQTFFGCLDYTPFESRVCGGTSATCRTDDDCRNSGVCTIFGNCVDCTNDASCPEDQFCDGSLRSCTSRRQDGTPCTRDRICASDQCSGVCTSCSTEADCGEGRWCDVLGACRDKRANGTLCVSGVECLSGHCYLGFCADCGAQAHCPDPNEFCTLNPLPGESTCLARKPFGSLCAQGLECASNRCDITCVDCTAAPQQGCNFTTQYCQGGRCLNKGALGATCGANNQCTSGNCHFGFCRTSCANDAGCPSNQWCDGGACVAQVGNGTLCTRDRICQSGICNGTCVTCSAIPARGCNFSTQYCEAQQCLPKRANGQTCGFNDQCTSGTCHFGFCRTPCSSDAGCSSSEWCDGGACVARVPNGTACGRDRVCQSGICDITCVQCTALPQQGCNFSTQYCEGQICRAKQANGESCAFGDQCTSGTCHFNVCRQPCANNDSECASNQWCDVFACVPQVPRGTPCGRNRVCQSGTCSFFFCT